MDKAQRNEMELKVTQHTGYALYHMATGELDAAREGLNVAQVRLQQLIDDEHDRARAERREYENEIMAGDEKSEES